MLFEDLEVDESIRKSSLGSLISEATKRSFSFCLQVLSCHIPFLVSSVEDFKDHIPRETDMKVTLNNMKSPLNDVFAGMHPPASCIIVVFPGGHECL